MSVRALERSLPRTIRVAAFDIAVRLESETWAYQNQRWGEFSPVEQRISIQRNFPSAAKMADTVLHEISHAIYWAYGIHDSDDEERTVSTISTGLVQVLRDNPALRKWLNRAVL